MKIYLSRFLVVVMNRVSDCLIIGADEIRRFVSFLVGGSPRSSHEHGAQLEYATDLYQVQQKLTFELEVAISLWKSFIKYRIMK